MPTITNADALLHAAQDMTTALKGGIAQSLETKAAIEQLMQIFKQNAEKEKQIEQDTPSQRVRMEKAQDQRVQLETELENEKEEFNIISQEEDDCEPPELVPPDPKQAPAYNTRSRRTTRSIAQEVMLMTLDISSLSKQIKPQNAAS